MSVQRLRSVLAVVAMAIVGTVVTPIDGTPTVAALGPTLNGGGSSFAKLEIDQWRAEVAAKRYNELSINYVAQGSSFGRQQYSSGSLDFAASDIPFIGPELTAVQNGPRGQFVYVPVSAGGLGFMYNLVDNTGQQVTDLNLTPRTACRIFTDDTIMWDDPEIQQVNLHIVLPHERVRAVVRADGSGTSYVLSEYCIATAPDVWEAFKVAEANNNNDVAELLAGRPISSWPTNRFGSAVAADGVAVAVADSSGLYSITYNEAGFAKVRGFPNANVQNAYGNFTQPTENAVSIALGYATGRSDGTFQLDFRGSDPDAYFPSTYSYVIAQTAGFDPAKGEVLARFLCYAITRGQRLELTEALGYARLSAPLVELGKNAIAQIPGAPPWEECRVESAPPPPAATPDDATTDTTPAGGSTGGGSTGGGSTGGGSTGGDATGGSTTGGSTTGGSTTGGSTTGGSTTGGSITTTTVVGSNPAGGSTTGGVTGSGEVATCVDPGTGLAAACESLASSDGGAAADGSVNASNAPTAAAVRNPPIEEDSSGPNTTQILWWLLQGASICAIGFALAGVRARMA